MYFITRQKRKVPVTDTQIYCTAVFIPECSNARAIFLFAETPLKQTESRQSFNMSSISREMSSHQDDFCRKVRWRQTWLTAQMVMSLIEENSASWFELFETEWLNFQTHPQTRENRHKLPLATRRVSRGNTNATWPPKQEIIFELFFVLQTSEPHCL